ncbi:MAG: zinc ABC transporter substrate-binding protein [Roseibium sp.]|uniref:zinc ABC transporter substrate-binding protein n=1 Tax=Roseibium sp. TaxID=1936156 RepID=UPI0026112114|nr:zinc ABC transporter substrate-binding protein [Roseibium sp.]MCV0428452.1 zinc ABC transporter substrate-binding protein [Roseibium sp.]
MTSPIRSQSNSLRRRLLFSCTTLAGVVGISLASQPAYADAPAVVTTIKPLHSIASAVMDGVGTPHILIDGSASPHGFALKPSQAFLLQGADAVFWIGPGLAPSLEKPINSMAADAATVALMDAAGIEHLAIREGANFDAHDHGDHDDHAEHGDDDRAEKHEDLDDQDHAENAKHDDRDKDEHADHDDHDDHEEHAHGEEEHGHDDHVQAEHADEHDHGHGDSKDAHIWLNPDNGIAIAGVMAETLAEIDPENAETYRNNAAKFTKQIEQLEGEIAEQLKPLEGKKFVVFHDAYHHFEHHFDFEASGSITLSPEALASADRVSKVQNQIKDLNVTCVFQEPQFDAKLVNVVIEGSDARKGTLDPLGTELANGPDLYPNLLKGLSDSLSGCLSGQS